MCRISRCRRDHLVLWAAAMLTIDTPDCPGQPGLDLETGECCATVGIAIGLVARIVSDPDGAATPEPSESRQP